MSIGKGLVFLGPPGSGKGTQAQKLSVEFRIPHISTGEILREAITDQSELGKTAKSYVEKGELVPDKLLLNLIQKRLNQIDAQKGWILDGFPRNIFQAEFLDTLLKRLGKFSEQAINLEVPDKVIIERLLLRGRKDDSEETICRRLEVYREKTQLVLDYYRQNQKLASINGDLQPQEVTTALRNTLAPGLSGIY